MKKTIVKAIIACIASAMLIMAAGCSGGNDSGTASNTAGLFPGLTNPTPAQTSQITTDTPQIPQTSTPPTTTVPTTSVPSTEPPETSTVIPSAPQPTGSINAAYVGTYYGAIDPNVLAGLSAEEQQYYQQIMNSTYMTLNADGSLTGSYGGQAITGTWSDPGSSQVSLNINGQALVYTIQNGIIYDSEDTSSYFQKR